MVDTAGKAMENDICRHADRSFGPAVPSGCRGGFDFTFLFEDLFLSLLPAIALLLASFIRLRNIRDAGVGVKSSLGLEVSRADRVRQLLTRKCHANSTKCATTTFAITQLIVLVLWSITPEIQYQLSIAASSVNLIASFAICVLSHVEGRRSSRPSPVLNVYLFGSSLFDIVLVRSLWLAVRYDHRFQPIAISCTVSLGLKIALLFLEAIPKANHGLSLSPEETSGVYSLRTFWWLNRLLWLGKQKQLEPDDLLSIDSDLKTARYSSQMVEAWDKGAIRASGFCGRCKLNKCS